MSLKQPTFMNPRAVLQCCLTLRSTGRPLLLCLGFREARLQGQFDIVSKSMIGISGVAKWFLGVRSILTKLLRRFEV